MFVRHQLVLAVSFQAAQARLENLTHGGWLSTASAGAYADGLAGLIRVGPFGAVPGASKLVKVSLLEPVPRDDVMVLPLRWEATGVTGGLFPVLDADLTMTPAGPRQTLMRLDGAYRPPLGAVGAGLDRVVLRRAATATIRSLLTRVADALTSPAPAAENATRPAAGQQPWLAIDPDSSP
jgi:hypothetical protein